MTKFLAVISGKGGTGKTTTLLNLSHILTLQGKKVLALDANFATPNLALHLGLIYPSATLNDFLERRKNITEVIQTHSSGIKFIPSSHFYSDFKPSHSEKLVEVFEHLENLFDYVLVDCPAGLGPELSQILNYTDEALIVVNPHLSSLIDAVKAIELAHEKNNSLPGFILNMALGGKHELKVKEIENTLNIPLLGNIPYDKKVKKALHQHVPSHFLYPHSKSSKQYLKIATDLFGEK